MDLILYFNIAVIAIIALGALIGLARGAFKSIYSLVVFVGLLVLGWLLTPIFAKMIMNFDVSRIYPLEIKGVVITKLNESITMLAGVISPSMETIVVSGSLAYEAVYEFIFMVIRIVSFIVWLVLMATIIKIIVKIIQKIILGKKAKEKKKAGSRLIGLFVGAAHGLAIVMIISVLLSGIATLSPILKIGVAAIDSEDVSFNLALNEDERIYLENTVPIDPKILVEVVDFLEEYRSTFGGQVSGLLKIKNQPFDEYVFSEMLSFKFEGQKVSLMGDLKKVITVFKILTDNIEGEISIESILALDEEILNDIFSNIAELELIGVAIPVGVEYLNKQIDVISEETYNKLIADILEVDFASELNNLKDALLAANNVGIFQEHENLDYLLTLNIDDVNTIFKSLGKLELVELLGKVGLEFLLNSEKANDFFEKNNIEKADLNFTNVNIADEISNLGDIYAGFRGLNLSFDAEKKLIFDNITDVAINTFGTAIYDSLLFSNNSGLLAKTLITVMPEDYRAIFTADDLNKTDFVAVLSLANVFLKANILDNENFDPLNLLTEENIDAISGYISSSDLLSSNVGALLEILLAQTGMPFEIEISEDIVWSGVSGKAELSSLFSSAKILLAKTNLPADLFTLSAVELDSILGSSIITQAIVKIIEKEAAAGGMLDGFLIIDRVVEWYDVYHGAVRVDGQLRKLFVSAKILFGDNPDFDDLNNLIKINNILSLTSEELDLLTDSIILKDSLANQLIKVGDAGILQINLPLFDLNWDTEIKNFIIGTKVLFGDDVDLNNITLGVDDVIELSTENIDKVVNSIILVDTAVDKITALTASSGSMEGLLIIPDSLNNHDYHGVNGELKRFLVASKIIKGPGSIEDVTFEVDKFLGPEQEVLLDSKIFEASIINFVKTSDKLIVPLISEVARYYYLTDTNIVWERTYSENLLTDIGELRKFLNGISDIVGTGTFTDLTFTMATMLAVDFTNVLQSRVLEATIASMIADLINDGSLTGFVKEPANSYQWYYHKTSVDSLTREVRCGEYILTSQPTYQYSDLLGMLEAIQKMNDAGLSFDNIDYNSIAAGNPNDLASALWDYSRVMRGSIATLLNSSLSGVSNSAKPVFADTQFTTKGDVLSALVTFNAFIALL